MTALVPLLLLFPQELADPVRLEEHSFSIRPPEGWRRDRVKSPTVLRFRAPVRSSPRPGIVVIHHRPQNPTPIAEYVRQLDRYLAEKYPGHEVDSSRTFRHGAHEAHRKQLRWKPDGGAESILVKMVVRRGLRDYYLVDAMIPGAGQDLYSKVVRRSMNSLLLQRTRLDEEEREGRGRFRSYCAGRKSLPPGLTGETWQTIHLAGRKVGVQTGRVRRVSEGYEFSNEVRIELGSGGRKLVRSSGTFTADGERQTVEWEETVEPAEGDKRVSHVKASLEEGRARMERDIQGTKETREFAVPPGTLFDDVADLFRRSLSSAQPGAYLFRPLSVYDDEPGAEFLEVAAPEKLGNREIRIVLTRSRSTVVTYWFGADGRPVRVSSARNPLVIRESTREEAVK